MGGDEALPAFEDERRGAGLRFARRGWRWAFGLRLRGKLEAHLPAAAGLQLCLRGHQAADQVGHFGDGAVALANGAHVTGRAVDIHSEAIAARRKS